jgi:hypothetical protein
LLSTKLTIASQISMQICLSPASDTVRLPL